MNGSPQFGDESNRKRAIAADDDAEQWIQWLAQSRQANPAAVLGELLGESSLSPTQLLDLACIDLMQQHRQSHHVTIESYLEQFPILAESNALLDLIDAELCVRREVGELRDDKSELASYRKRFPILTDEIESLLNLKSEPQVLRSFEIPTPATVATGNAAQTCDSQQSTDLSFDLLPPVSSNDPAISVAHPTGSPPIDAPEWFLGERCMNSSDDHWLIRGRDSNTGETMAMKVIRLPTQTSSIAIDRLLKACEHASRVQNPCWAAPVVAAAQGNYLAVIRPWVFGVHWQVASQIDEVPSRLRSLAKIAYALQSGHNRHACHGSLHSKNVIVDHQGDVHLVDAVGAATGLSRLLGAIEPSANGSARFNDSVDANDLTKLILQDDVDVPGMWSSGLRDVLHQLVTQHHSECFAQIGDELMKRADSFVPDDQHQKQSSALSGQLWRKKISRWIGG